MTVTQRDARSVWIEHDGLAAWLAYRLWWEGRDRSPESIAVDGNRVTAFFLSAAIRDTVTADAHGVAVHRRWSVKSAGRVRLTVDVHFAPEGPPAYFLPGVALGAGLPDGGVAADGERTAWPSAAFVGIGGRGTFGFSPHEGPFAAGIAIAPVSQDDVPPVEREEGPAPLALVLTLPGAGKPADNGDEPASIESPGTLEVERTFRLVSAPLRRAWLHGASAVLAAPGGPADATAREPAGRAGEKQVREAVRRSVERCLGTHLLEKGGVAGLRIEPSSPLLSASAGAGMAVLLLELFADDPERVELALRLADFALKGQHPSGLFYESYHAGRGEWRGVPGRPDRPVIGIEASARVADRLLALAAALRGAGRPCEKYRLAGLRFVEFFLDERGRFQMPGALHLPGVRAPLEPGLAGLELAMPLARVLAATGRDRYRKAFDAIVHEVAGLPWGTPWLPSSRAGRDPDSAAALRCGRIVLAAAHLSPAGERRTAGASRLRAGAKARRAPVDAGDAASIVLPWVRAHRGGAGAGVDALGGIVDSFHRGRIVDAGAEAGFVLAGLASLATEPWMRRTLEGYARGCLAFADRTTLAGSGPLDARRLVAEAGYRLAAASRSAARGGCAGRARRPGETP